MSDDMATHKRGRRNIRRLTRRKIALPTLASPSQRPPSESLDSLASPSTAGEPERSSAHGPEAANAGLAVEGAGVASSLSELRLPEDSSKGGDAGAAGTESAEDAAAEGGGGEKPPEVAPANSELAAEGGGERPENAVPSGGESAGAGSDQPAGEGPRSTSDESPEDEPTTNPHIRLSEGLGSAASPDAIGFDSPQPTESAKSGAQKPPPAAGPSSKPPPAPSANKLSDAASNGLDSASEQSLELATEGDSTEGDAESEPVTGQHRKVSVPPPSAATTAPRRPDSDAPTRPRIELSSEMALAAGRVTSLELSPIRSEQPPRRGSKVPPPGGESRVVSSLTGRRSAFPVSSDEEDAAARPSVIVTRSKIISDRPPRPNESESLRPHAKREAEPAKRVATETDRRDVTEVAKREAEATVKRPEELKPQLELAAAESEIPEPETAEIVKIEVTESLPPISMRPSRRPGSGEGEEFETLDIEDGEVESHSMRAEAGETEIDADFDEAQPTKAPPPPPQLKRAGAPPAPAVPPKAAPPPPPRVSGQQPTTAANASVATSMPAPTVPGNSQLAAVGGGGGMISPASFTGGGSGGGGSSAGAPARKGGRGQPRRRQWWETLFSDEYLRTVVRPTVAQIARQVDFMQASLGVTKGTAVLDVGCGLGQHALEFARRGCLVVALDLALPMITRAAEEAQQEGLRINFLHKDIRDIGFEGTFDAVVCVGTTFGFFDDEQNREVLGRLANALKPGGRLLLEVVNRDHVLDSQPNLQWFEGDGCVVMEESDFNYYSSRLTVKRTMMREDGRQTESEYSIRLYALHELGQMMQQAGFRVKEVSGGQTTRGVFFGVHSSRIILLAERRTPAAARGNGHSPSDAPAPTES